MAFTVNSFRMTHHLNLDAEAALNEIGLQPHEEEQGLKPKVFSNRLRPDWKSCPDTCLVVRRPFSRTYACSFSRLPDIDIAVEILELDFLATAIDCAANSLIDLHHVFSSLAAPVFHHGL